MILPIESSHVLALRPRMCRVKKLFTYAHKYVLAYLCSAESKHAQRCKSSKMTNGCGDKDDDDSECEKNEQHFLHVQHLNHRNT